MHRFSTELEYSFFILEDVQSVALTCFVSHKSVSYLDLQINESHLSRRFLYAPFLWEKTFFCTEESLRNYLVPKRRILYTLNLDVPHGREYSHLRNGLATRGFALKDESIFVVVRVRGFDEFYNPKLDLFIKSALEQTDCKIKLLKWMADFRPLESFIHYLSLQSSCAMVLYRECDDIEFSMEFFAKFLRLRAVIDTGELKVLEYFLYHARLLNFDIRKSYSSSLTDYCIEYQGFPFVHSLLKYEDSVYYTSKSYEDYWCHVFRNIRPRIRREDILVNQRSEPRLYRMLQILLIFKRYEEYPRFSRDFRRPDTSVALGLIWSSIPDHFVSLQEMNDACGQVLPAEYISRAHSFYEGAIGQTVSRGEPRPLTQYCRSVLRKSLHDSKQWLPEGIEQLKLPPRLEAFLNLQSDNLRPENFQGFPCKLMKHLEDMH